MIDGYDTPPSWLSDEEVADLVALSERPDMWPPEHRQSLPLIRDIVARWQTARRAPQLSAEEIARRIGA